VGESFFTETIKVLFEEIMFMLKSIKPLKLLLTLALSVTSLNIASLNLPAFSQEKTPNNVLTVVGNGSRMVQTTIAQVHLGVVVEAKTAQEIQTAIATKTNAIVAKLRELKVEQLQTTGITLNPKYDNNDRQKQIGFTGQSNVSFRTSIEQAGATLDSAIAAGANRVNGISFVAPDKETNEASNASLQDATKDAQRQANAVLSVLNLKAQSIRKIQVYSPPIAINNYAYSMDYSGRVDALEARVSTLVIGGQQRVTTTVTLEINY
jgi:uncharacterized protein